MAAVNELSYPHRLFQESTKEIKDMCKQANKQVTPLVHKYILGRTMSGGLMMPTNAERNRRAGQQADNLVWQQEMFHKLVKLQGLLSEGLASEAELGQCRKEVLTVVTAAHLHGEWADFTRDKLLFLQDLLRAGCISETEYHSSKSPVLSRLAEQGALIDSEDFVMLVRPAPAKGAVGHDAPECRASARIAGDASVAETETATAIGDNNSARKTPIKQMLEAMTRLKNNNRAIWGADSGPTREAPSPPVGRRMMISKEALRAALLGRAAGAPAKEWAQEHEDLEDDESLTALYASPPVKKASLSPSPSMGHRRMGSLLSGLVRKFHGDQPDAETYSPLTTDDDAPQQQQLQQQHDEEPSKCEAPPRVLREGSHGPGPDTVKLKKKINARGPPTNFFIDKVLGDNIKAELARIRTEISLSNPSQEFTNDQIDAIATRLPVDKVELQRFFPKTWCDKYGDMVLEVVHKEFKGHVGEMENQRRIGKQQRRANREAREQAAAEAACKLENDENRNNANVPRMVLVQNLKARGAIPVKKLSKENLSECPTGVKAKLPLIEESPDKANCRRAAGFEQEMDGKLSAEIQRMPSQRLNITLR